MKLQYQHRRAGLTLTESLVALFIMAFGVLSLMTLFPLGAIRMGQSLRDDRLAQCAWQADGITRTWWQSEVVEKPGNEAAFWKSLDTGTGGTPVAATDPGPSYVVAVDPIGYALRGGGSNFGGASGPGTSQITRQTSGLFIPTNVLTQNAAIRTCSLFDDVSFNKTGTPDMPAGSVIRQGNYNWLVMMQRPSNRDRYTVNFKVLVFDRRSPTSTAPREQVFTTLNNATAGSNIIDLVNPTQTPALKKGGWVMDGTNGKTMDFYRVKSFTEIGTTYRIELDTQLKNNCTSLYIFERLEEVFDRPQLTAPTFSNPLP